MQTILSDIMLPQANYPITKQEAAALGGKIRRCAATALVPPLLKGDRVYFADIPATARIHSLHLAADDLGEDAKAMLGLTCEIKEQPDIFASSIPLGGQSLPFSDQRYMKPTISSLNDPAWKLAGLNPEEQHRQVQVMLTLTEPTHQEGHISLVIEYVVD